jgi:hypothetical protein
VDPVAEEAGTMSSITPDDVASLATKYDAFLDSLTPAETEAFTRVIHVARHAEDADVEGFAMTPAFDAVFGAIPGTPTGPGGDAAGVSSVLRACVAGAHYKTVVLSMRKAGGDPKSAGGPF